MTIHAQLSTTPTMSEEQLIVAPDERVTSVDDGEYFATARNYARLLFDVPIIERSYALLAVALIMCALIANAITLSSLWPLKHPIRMMIENNNSGLEYPRIVRLSPDQAPLQVAVGRYALTKYVQFFESYQYSQNELAPAYRFIYNNSAPEIFQSYRAQLDPANPQSRIIQLGQTSTRTVDNVTVKITSSSTTDGIVSLKAEGSFIENTRIGAEITTKKRHFDAEMMMYELAVHNDTNSVYQYDPQLRRQSELNGRVGFRITRYQSQP